MKERKTYCDIQNNQSPVERDSVAKFALPQTKYNVRTTADKRAAAFPTYDVNSELMNIINPKQQVTRKRKNGRTVLKKS